jgi:hypothetical protein
MSILWSILSKAFEKSIKQVLIIVFGVSKAESQKTFPGGPYNKDIIKLPGLL